MRHPMMSVLEQNPVLPAVKDAGRLEACLAQPAGVVFLLCGDILNIDRLIDRVHQAGKYAVVHADLVAGLAPREIAVDFLHRCGADGIISTRPMLLRRGRELGMLTVLRVFAIDSKAVSNLGRETEGGMPDVIEILPGTLCKALRAGLVPAAWVLLNALGMGTALNLLAALYFVNFLVNACQSLTLRSERLFAAGMWLFLLCDVCVGLRNQPSLLPGLAGAAQVGMWLFYLPGQVLLVLSGFPKRRGNTT